MSLDVGQLAGGILGAFEGAFADQWPKVRDFATGEAQKLAVSMVQITGLYATHQISEAEASVLLEMQRNATRTVLLAIEGMGIITVEMAINAALDVVKDAVNGAIGFALLA